MQFPGGRPFAGNRDQMAQMVHEFNHNIGVYGYDYLLKVARDDNAITVPAKAEYINAAVGTIASDEAMLSQNIDKDPLSGYELLRSGILPSEQVATGAPGQTTDVRLEGLTTIEDGIKLISLPLQFSARWL